MADKDAPTAAPRAAAEVRGDHEPVMLARIVELLIPAVGSGGVVVDATVGLGGHAAALLHACSDATVIGLDRDPQALAVARSRLARFGPGFRAYQANFDESQRILDDADVAPPAAFLFDLGVSSLQLDSDARGFAYSRDTHLDMRMDPQGPLTAEDVVNDYSPEELARVFAQYGEERFARRIAQFVVREREHRAITTSHQLTRIIQAAVPVAARRKGHPGKRVFQALRIEVNDELGALTRGLDAALRRVRVGGRVVVLAYHSLEDRLVKRAFSSGATSSAPPGMPVIPASAQPFLKLVTRGAEVPDAAEVAANPRAASARLRAAAKIAPVRPGWVVAS